MALKASKQFIHWSQQQTSESKAIRVRETSPKGTKGSPCRCSLRGGEATLRGAAAASRCRELAIRRYIHKAACDLLNANGATKTLIIFFYQTYG